MPKTTNESDVAAHPADGAVESGRIRRDPASLVFIACAECASVISLAASVRSVSGRLVCWNCGLLSLRG